MSRVSKIERILEAIPADEWIKATDVEEKTGLSAHSIGALIAYHLLNELVDRRHTRKYERGHYEYRRLIRIRRHDGR